MKKAIFTLLGIVLATASVVAATLGDNDRVIKYEELPAKARTFINDHFPNDAASTVWEDKELSHTEYKVVLASGTKIEFDAAGEWDDVECRGCAVPAAIVPAKIAVYVAKHYASSTIVEIAKDRNDWDVKLNNDLELEFDKEYRLVEVDD
jgi:hypothetical protein